jgi:O-antigen ligase
VITTFGTANVSVPTIHVLPASVATIAIFVVIAVALSIITRRKPAFAVAALIISGPFDLARALGPTTITLPKAVLVGGLLGLALRRASLRPLLAPKVRPLAFGALAIVMATAVSAIPATYIDATARETFKALEYFATFACACLAFAEDPDEALLWNTIGIATALVCTLALVQDVTTAPSGIVLAGRTLARIAGPLDGPNQLAGWCDLVIPMLVARALLGARTAPFTWLAVLAAVTDALTLSRSSYIALVPGLGIVAYAACRAGLGKRVMLGTAYLVAPIAALFALFAVGGLRPALAEFLAWAAPSNGELRLDDGLAPRSVLWRAAFKMWATDPGLGVGAGNFELLTPTVGLIGVRTHANNLYLQSLAEGGILLFAATLWTIVAAIAALLRDSRGALGIGIAAATVALAVHQGLDDLTFYPKVGGLWWTLLGVGAASIGSNATRANATRGRDESSL